MEVFMNQKKIGKFIQERRKIKELTQVELAEKLGVSNRTISSWENGNSMPDYSIFQDLCNELDISINELFSGEKISKEDYKTKAEENMSKLINDNYSEKKKINWIIAISVAVVYLSISILFDIWAYSWIIWVGYSIYRFIKK